MATPQPPPRACREQGEVGHRILVVSKAPEMISGPQLAEVNSTAQPQ